MRTKLTAAFTIAASIACSGAPQDQSQVGLLLIGLGGSSQTATSTTSIPATEPAAPAPQPAPAACASQSLSVTDIFPAANAVAPLDTAIYANFNNLLSAGAISGSSVTISPDSQITPSYSNPRATIGHARLERNTAYNVTLASDITDCLGQSLGSNYSWSFRTPWTVVLDHPPQSSAFISDRVTRVGVDPSGNVFIVGWSFSSFTSDPADQMFYLAKYSPDGILQWIYQNRAVFTSSAFPAGLTIDSQGNAFVTGAVSHSISGNTSAGQGDLFLAKFSPSGNLVFAKQVGSSSTDGGFQIAIDPSGDIFVGGTTVGSIGITNPNPGYSGNPILLKFSPAGSLQWVRQYPTEHNEQSTGLAQDSSGNLYLTGHGDGDVPGDEGVSNYFSFIMKYDRDGNLLQRRTLAGSSVNSPIGNPEGGIIASVGRGFVKFNSNLQIILSSQSIDLVDHYLENEMSGVTTTPSGSICVSGYTKGGQQVYAIGDYDAFASCYTSAGNRLWSKRILAKAPDGTGFDSANSIAADSNGNLYLGIEAQSPFDGYANPNGFRRAVIAKFNSSGNRL